MAWMKKSNNDISEKLQGNDENFSENQDYVKESVNSQSQPADNFVQLGLLLVSARNKANLTKEQIIEKLKIKEENLDAIEKGDIGALTMPRPILRSFLRGYCKLVGAKNLWREYNRLTIARTYETKIGGGLTGEIEENKDGFYSVTTNSKKSKIFIFSFLLIVILLAIYFVFQLRGDIASQAISSAEMVMGLNPIDKNDSQEDKNASTENASNDTLNSDDDGDQTNEAVQQADSGLNTQPLKDGETTSVVDEANKSENKLPTDTASFGWLDKESKPQDSGTQTSKPLVAEEPNLPPKDKRIVTVKAVNVLWIRVSTPHRRIFQGLMKKGEVKSFEVQSIPVTIRYGKGDKALVTWNGVENLASNSHKPITVTYTLSDR